MELENRIDTDTVAFDSGVGCERQRCLRLARLAFDASYRSRTATAVRDLLAKLIEDIEIGTQCLPQTT